MSITLVDQERIPEQLHPKDIHLDGTIVGEVKPYAPGGWHASIDLDRVGTPALSRMGAALGLAQGFGDTPGASITDAIARGHRAAQEAQQRLQHFADHFEASSSTSIEHCRGCGAQLAESGDLRLCQTAGCEFATDIED